MAVRKIKARQIFDSRGEPTIEVDVITDIGLLRSSVPSLLFLSDNGAKDIRDGDKATYNGRSVFKVMETINNVIAPEILKSKLEVTQQREIDSLMQNMDGTPDKSKLGVNSIIAVSIACCKAAAAKKGLPLYRYIASLCDNVQIHLPVPVFNVMSGGRAASNNLVYQEFLILPTGAESFTEAMKIGADVYRQLEQEIAELQEIKTPLTIANEGSFTPELEDDKEALELIDRAIANAGYEGKVKTGVDVAASSFFKEGLYDLEFKTEDSDPENYLESQVFRDQYDELLSSYPSIIFVEDPFDLSDWESWPMIVTSKPGLLIVADELTTMNVDRLKEAIERKAANCLLVRLEQIGTVTEALDCVKMAKDAGWECVVSASDGETEDTFIADFAVGIAAGQFKAGAPCRGERIAKYNQILRIEEELGQEAKYIGEKFNERSAE